MLSHDSLHRPNTPAQAAISVRQLAIAHTSLVQDHDAESLKDWTLTPPELIENAREGFWHLVDSRVSQLGRTRSFDTS